MGEQVDARFIWGCSSVGRAPALQAGGQEFDSPHLHHPDTKSGKTHISYEICLFFENCIEERIRKKKHFIKRNQFSDVPKEISKNHKGFKAKKVKV